MEENFQTKEQDTQKIILDCIKSLNTSLEMEKVLYNNFKYLKGYFPLEAISLHMFSKNNSEVQQLCFTTDRGCEVSDERFVLKDYEAKRLEYYESSEKKVRVFTYADTKYKNLLKNYFFKKLKNKNPSMLITLLKSDSKIIGYIQFFSKKGHKFTEEHCHLFELLKDVFTSIMLSIYSHHEVFKSMEKLQNENNELKRKNEARNEFIGNSEKITKALDMVETLAPKELSILILGETGTGKELIADMLQRKSKRKNNIFLKVNCGAIPESLIDSELFGHEKGAFTGAFEVKKGYFEQADGGTLFLDELGELSLQAQVRLLRVLQFGLIERVGGKKSIPVDVRIIAATNRNLENMLQLGTFREDLYYRLHAFPIRLPALRERKEDIALLLKFFIDKIAKKENITSFQINTEKLRRLYAYSWPGNVRELENIVERSMILSRSNTIDFTEHLPDDPRWYLEQKEEIKQDTKPELKAYIMQCIEEYISEKDCKIANKKHESYTIDDKMREEIIKALKQSKGRVTGKNSAAVLLDINEHTLRKRMQKLGIDRKKDSV